MTSFSIFYYIIFILVFQYTYLFSIKKIATKFESVKTTQTINNEQEASSFKFVVNPWIVLTISFLLIGVDIKAKVKLRSFKLLNTEAILVAILPTTSPSASRMYQFLWTSSFLLDLVLKLKVSTLFNINFV